MRWWRVLFVVLAALTASGLAQAAEAEKRIALVIGIGAYKYAPELPNPPNDARAIAEALRGLDFEVDEHYDLDNRAFATALREFGIKAGEADVAVVFYAGHGIQVGGHNYLIPADARLERERDLVYEALPLNLPLGELAQARKLGILILDACRNNPFVDRLASQGASRLEVSPGLGRIDDTPSDTLVAMATRADQVAEDGSGAHSPYTLALLEHFQTPGLELSLFFRKVRDSVKQSTQDRQEPYIFGSLGATPFYFNPQPPNRAPELAGLAPVTVLDRGPAAPLRIERPRDPDADPLFAQITGLPQGGSVLIGERVVLIGDYLTVEQLAATAFKADASRTGPAGSFEFVVMDGRGGQARGTVQVSIEPSNRPPVAVAERTVRVIGNPLGFEPPVDPDGDPLTITVASVPERGKVMDGERPVRPGDRVSPEVLNTLVFEPGDAPPGKAGIFRVTIEDGRGGRTSSDVILEVGRAEDPPQADIEKSVWELVRESGSRDHYEAFLRIFGQGAYATLAQEYLGRLEPQEVQVASSEDTPAPVLPPEEEDVAAQDAAPEQLALADPPDAASQSTPRTQGKANGFQDCAGCPVMVRLQPGRFEMGNDRGHSSERPAHAVTLAAPFALGAYEVTVAEWRLCVEEGGCAGLPRMTGASELTPVHNLHWDEVQAYVQWLSQKTGRRYRLPSEAEWEYAARAGTATPFWWAGAEGIFASCEDCGGPIQRLTPVSVGSFEPNPFGLHDMNGGVAEWVADCWNADYQGAPADGSAWLEGNCRKRVLRGGSWRNPRTEITATARLGYDADVRYFTNGFRVARDLD